MKICVGCFEEKFKYIDKNLRRYITHFKLNVKYNDFIEFEVDENIVEVDIDVSKGIVREMNCNCNNHNCVHKYLVYKYLDENEIDLSCQIRTSFKKKMKEEFEKLSKEEIIEELMCLNEKYSNVKFYYYKKINEKGQNIHRKDTLEDIIKILDGLNDANNLLKQCLYSNLEWEYRLKNDDRFLDYGDEGFDIDNSHFIDLITTIKGNLLKKLKFDSISVKELIFDLNDLLLDEKYSNSLYFYVCSSIYKEVVEKLSFDSIEFNKINKYINDLKEQYNFHLLTNSFYKFINKNNFLDFKELFDDSKKKKSWGNYVSKEKTLYLKNKEEYLKYFM